MYVMIHPIVAWWVRLKVDRASTSPMKRKSTLKSDRVMGKWDRDIVVERLLSILEPGV